MTNASMLDSRTAWITASAALAILTLCYGAPLVSVVAMKPIATTLTPIESVDLASGEPRPIEYERSDFCPVPRAGVIGEAMACVVLADALIEKLGGDSLAEMLPRFESLKRARLDDLDLGNTPTVFWP